MSTTGDKTELSKRKLFVGLPIHETVDPVFMLSVMRVISGGTKIPVELYPHCGDSLVCRARNSIVRRFLESDCTHLLQIDSDLVFNPEHVERIAQHDVDIVGGVYCKKQEGDPQIVANTLDDRTVETLEDGDLVRVKYVGTGFFCVSRRVFEKMIEKFGEDMRYSPDHEKDKTEYDFFRAAPYQYKGGYRRYLSEDWWFCQKAIDLDFKIWMDLKCVLKHSGPISYPLSYQAEKLFASAKAGQNCAGDAAIPSAEPALSVSQETPVNRIAPLVEA